jgi:hypothetical protein
MLRMGCSSGTAVHGWVPTGQILPSPGYQATFMRFLTCTMADQTAMGLKGQVIKLEKQVMALTNKLDVLVAGNPFW